jgi:hypothetical protein
MGALVALVLGAGAFVVRSRASSTGEVASECRSLPVQLATDGSNKPATIDRADVVVHSSSSNAMSGFNGATVVMSRSGTVVALDEWLGSHGPTYRSVRVDEATVAAWQACLESTGFRSLDGDYAQQQGPTADGRFCAVSDASDTTISAGPATSSVKVVTAYALGMQQACLGKPALLETLASALERLRSSVAASGEPTDAPTDDLAPH